MRVAVLLAGWAIGCGGGNPDASSDGPGSPGTDGPGTGDAADGPGATVDAPPDPCAPGTWCVETAPVSTLLRDVVAIDLNDVIAVGDGGTILQRRDNTWTQMRSGTTENLKGVWAASASDVWAVGDAGTILRYDGTSWSPFGTFTQSFSAIWGAGPDDVFIVGATEVQHFTGQGFVGQTGLSGPLFSISGTSSTNVWVTGENAKVDHYTGTWTTGIDPGAGNTYFGIVAVDANVWVTSFTPNKNALRLEGNTWVVHSPSPTAVFQDLYAISSTDIWGAGLTKTGHWDGSTWTVEVPAGAGVSMFGISGIGQSLWIVGQNGFILHRR